MSSLFILFGLSFGGVLFILLRIAFFSPIWLFCGCFFTLVFFLFFTTKRHTALFFVASLCGFLLFSLRFSLFPFPSPLALPDQAFTHSNEIIGIVEGMPDWHQTFTQYRIRLLSCQFADGSFLALDVPRTLLVNDRSPFPRFLPGDRLSIVGKFSQHPTDDSSFSYPLFLRARGIDATLSFSSIHFLSRDSSLSIALFRFLALLRQSLIDRAHSILPLPHASLLMGLTIGADGTIAHDTLKDFRTAGLTHILAVSGSNVTLLLTLLFPIFFFLPLRFRVLPLVLSVIFFTLFVGADAPVVRAGIMGIIGLFALLSERKTIPLFSLLCTFFLMILWNPLSLLFDAGFQLSFLATLGIIVLSPFFVRKLSFLPQVFALRESFATTLSAFLFTLPVSVGVFHQLSLIAPLSNLLIAPLIAPGMFFGSLAVFLSFFSSFLAFGTSLFAWAFLDLLMVIAHYCALLPFASIFFQT